MLLLPNFQRSFGVISPPFFNGGAKVSGLFISTKIFLLFIQNYLCDFFEELTAIFKRAAKLRGLFLFQQNFYSFFVLKKLCHFSKNYSLFFQAGCKDNQLSITTKLFSAILTKFFLLKPFLRTIRFSLTGRKYRTVSIPTKHFFPTICKSIPKPTTQRGFQLIYFFFLTQNNRLQTPLSPNLTPAPAPKNQPSQNLHPL